MNITLKRRIGPITDLQRKARISTTANLLQAVGVAEYKRILEKVRRIKA